MHNILRLQPRNSTREINCYKHNDMSKDTIIKFSVEKIKFFSDEYYETMGYNVTKEVAKELKLLYEGKEADTALLKAQLTPILDKINSKYDQIVPLFEENIFKNKESTKIIEAPFLLSLNILLRSSKYAFIPYREISYVSELIKRTLYSRHIIFINIINPTK